MDKNKISQMNYYLLSYFNINTLNKGIIKENINKIEIKLKNINESTDKLKYLSLSCIFGAFLGDSIGSNCEFSKPSADNYKYIYKNVNGRFLIGEITDDSELAMSSAFAYIDANDKNDQRIQDLIYYYFCIWKESHPKDMGYATFNSLKFWNPTYTIEQTKFDKKVQSLIVSQNFSSLSNGVLMRISTFIVFYFYTNYEKINRIINNYFNLDIYYNELSEELLNLLFDIFNKVYINAKVTHPNPEISISAAVFSLLVLTGMIKNNANDIYSLFKIISISKKFIEYNKDDSYKNYAKITQKKFAEIIYEIEKNLDISVYNMMGYYIHGFKLSIYFLYKISKMGEIIDNKLYYKIMCQICNFGGDTDTNCAIVGTMIGPLIGYKNFPPELFDKFIKYFPEKRTQYTSAFMYIYVTHLEEKYYQHKNYMQNYGYKNDFNISKNPSFAKILDFLTKKYN